jgi:nicotinamidase-related amidase
VTGELPVPPHFAPEQVGEVWPVPYDRRAEEAERWAREQALTSAAADDVRTCLVLVDCQNTFCIPGFELYVGGRSGTGAVDDSRRICEFVYRNLGAITRIVPTLDTHQAYQIFHAAFLVDREGKHPPPYTVVSVDEIERGIWRASAPEHQRHLLHYVRELAREGKYELTVWPYHALLGGIGHALVAAVEEAVFFHAIARQTQPDFQVKGRHPLTEHYSMLGPEVTTDPDGAPLEGLDERAPLLDELRDYDAVIVAGQAKSHCVAWTIDDLLGSFGELAPKVYLLEDCTSPVVVPGIVDYTDDADAAFRRFAAAGMHVVRSTEPLTAWPGLRAPQAA